MRVLGLNTVDSDCRGTALDFTASVVAAVEHIGRTIQERCRWVHCRSEDNEAPLIDDCLFASRTLAVRCMLTALGRASNRIAVRIR